MTLSDIKPLVNLPFLGVVLPTIELAADLKVKNSVAATASNLEVLTQFCRNAFQERMVDGRIPAARVAEYGDRVKLELDAIEALGFVDYILMIWDICRFADEQKIARGPGRGSVSSSLVCHLIGITELDPIEHGFFFTRFLSKARAKTKTVDGVVYCDGSLVPDVDMDFDNFRREEIFDYLSTRYPGQTCRTLTTTTFTSKALITDVLKVYENAGREVAQAAADLIDKESGIPEEIEDALSNDKTKENVAFKEWAKDHKETVEIAMALSGLNHAEGQHASAFLICAYPIADLMPLQSAASDTGRTMVSGYDMYSAQEVCLKFDILGLKALPVIQQVCERVGIRPQDINVNDPAIYRELQDFQRRYGIFQLETFAQGNAAARVKPRNFEQLAAVLAIARPGAFAYLGQLVDYVNRGTFVSIHPLIDDILKPTGGVAVFQEQMLQMLVRVGLTPDESEGIRKVIGKKLKDKVPECKAKIAEVCERNGHPKEIVDLLLKIMEDSGGYSFSSCHAGAYSVISARCLYLKLHHPIEFYWALLRMTRHESDHLEKAGIIESEMRSHELKLLPPSFGASMGFEIESRDSIRFALGMVRGISDQNTKLLATFIGAGGLPPGASKFAAFQALQNAGLHLGVVSSLVQAGCLADYETHCEITVGGTSSSYRSRSRLVLEFCTWNLLTGKDEKQMCLTVGDKPEVQWDLLRAIIYLTTTTNEKGKPLIKATRFATIKKHYLPYKEIYEMNSRNERLANFWYERRALGYSYSESLRSIFGDYIDNLTSVEEARKMPKDSRCRLIGFVAAPFKGKTKKGNAEFRFELRDETGVARVKAFNEKIDSIVSQNGQLCEEGDLVIVNVKHMGEAVCFVERGLDGMYLATQTSKIYTKLSELKDKTAKASIVSIPI